MSYIVREPLDIWHDEDMTEGHQEVPAGVVIEETRATRHKRSDAIWVRFQGNHVGHALRTQFQNCTVERGDDAGPAGHYGTVRFLKYTS